MRLTTRLASITEAFVTLDRQCCFTYLNQESERLLQKTTADLLGLELWHDFSEGLAQRLREQLRRALKSNRRIELEDFFPSLGKWLEVRAYPFAEGLAVYFRDVTERRRSQEQLMLLETSVARLNDIVAIAEAGSGPDDEPRMVFVNDAFEKQTGYSRDEVLGQTPRMLLELDPAMLKLREMAKGLQETRQARTELMVHRKNGASFWVELEVVSVQASAEEVTHWVAVGRDITQRKTAEDMIRHLAFYDPLTDLPNRQLLLDRLQKALSQSARTGQHGALMFIDLDNF
jgi:PAS domain S-box-containing protein